LRAGARAGLAINPGTAVEAQRLHDLERGGLGENLDVGGGRHAGVLGEDGPRLATSQVRGRQRIPVVRAPLTVRALAWYRGGRCLDCVTGARVSGVDIKAGL